MMMELGILELNALVYAMHVRMKEDKMNVEKYGGGYFETELERSKALYDKITKALWAECEKADDAIKALKNAGTQPPF